MAYGLQTYHNSVIPSTLINNNIGSYYSAPQTAFTIPYSSIGINPNYANSGTEAITFTEEEKKGDLKTWLERKILNLPRQ